MVKQIRRKGKLKAHLEDLHLLQNQLLCLQVIFGQNNHFLNRPLVCTQTHTGELRSHNPQIASSLLGSHVIPSASTTAG